MYNHVGTARGAFASGWFLNRRLQLTRYIGSPEWMTLVWVCKPRGANVYPPRHIGISKGDGSERAAKPRKDKRLISHHGASMCHHSPETNSSIPERSHGRALERNVVRCMRLDRHHTAANPLIRLTPGRTNPAGNRHLSFLPIATLSRAHDRNWSPRSCASRASAESRPKGIR